MSRRYTTEEWIELAKKKHGDRYDYSKSIYSLGKEEIVIICPDHGKVKQLAGLHLKYGPICCQGEKSGRRRTSNSEEFISKAKEKFGEKFDYSLVEYTLAREKVKIRCPIHGIFDQSPNKHLTSKQGCWDCGVQARGDAQRHSIDEFIIEANKVHDNKYDYSRVAYQTANINVEIICNEHGSFFPTPALHIHQKTGCPDCAELGFNPDEFAFYYVNEIINTETSERLFYKAGISNDWERRLYHLSRTLPNHMEIRNIEYIEFEKGRDASNLEIKLKKVDIIKAPIRKFPGGTELFLDHPLNFAREVGWI